MLPRTHQAERLPKCLKVHAGYRSRTEQRENRLEDLEPDLVKLNAINEPQESVLSEEDHSSKH